VGDQRGGGASSLRAYVIRSLPDYAPILVSNRAPREPKPDGGFARGAGGVVTALLTMAEATGADWVACARNDAEREVAAKHGAPMTVPLLQASGRLHYATPTREQYDMYYGVISNPVLWFIQHYLWDLGNEPIIDQRIHQAWTEGYVEVNRQMAEAVVRVGRAATKRPLVRVHDYQLYLVPRMVRQELPAAVIQHFVHVPWPTPQYWKVLPKPMRDAILEGLLGCDIVGFQSSLDVRNFLLTCEENGGLQVDERERAVVAGGRVVYARHYPLARGQATGGGPGALAPEAPHRAHRPHGSIQEHRAWIHRLRETAALSPRAARRGAVLGLPAAITPGRRGVQPLPAPDPSDGRPHQQRARHR
jgi:trehalose 6-phosphate synthase